MYYYFLYVEQIDFIQTFLKFYFCILPLYLKKKKLLTLDVNLLWPYIVMVTTESGMNK